MSKKQKYLDDVINELMNNRRCTESIMFQGNAYFRIDGAWYQLIGDELVLERGNEGFAKVGVHPLDP